MSTVITTSTVTITNPHVCVCETSNDKVATPQPEMCCIDDFTCDVTLSAQDRIWYHTSGLFTIRWCNNRDDYGPNTEAPQVGYYIFGFNIYTANYLGTHLFPALEAGADRIASLFDSEV